MKVWQKLKQEDLGKVLIIWRHRALSRFYTKIFTWLLGGYVSGIIASIFFNTVGLPGYSLPSARLVFVIVFISGVISAYFRNVVNGLQYQITEKGVASIKPVCGFEKVGELLGSKEKPFMQKKEFVLWSVVKEISDEDNSLSLAVKDQKDPLTLGIAPIAMFENVENNESPVFNKGVFNKNEKLDKECLKKIVQKARELRKFSMTV